MVLRRFRREQEADVTVLLTDSARKHQCSPEFVDDLCNRVMNPALEELDRCFGGTWGREIEPSLILEGPGLAFRVTVVKVKGWELSEMGARISQVFNKYWEQEVDRFPPR